jgi:hypothetical protein
MGWRQGQKGIPFAMTNASSGPIPFRAASWWLSATCRDYYAALIARRHSDGRQYWQRGVRLNWPVL